MYRPEQVCPKCGGPLIQKQVRLVRQDYCEHCGPRDQKVWESINVQGRSHDAP